MTWKHESRRHSLASRGISTKPDLIPVKLSDGTRTIMPKIELELLDPSQVEKRHLWHTKHESSEKPQYEDPIISASSSMDEQSPKTKIYPGKSTHMILKRLSEGKGAYPSEWVTRKGDVLKSGEIHEGVMKDLRSTLNKLETAGLVSRIAIPNPEYDSCHFLADMRIPRYKRSQWFITDSGREALEKLDEGEIWENPEVYYYINVQPEPDW